MTGPSAAGISLTLRLPGGRQEAAKTTIGIMATTLLYIGFYGDNGKENGNYYTGSVYRV